MPGHRGRGLVIVRIIIIIEEDGMLDDSTSPIAEEQMPFAEHMIPPTLPPAIAPVGPFWTGK
ncbi:hypothetical protein AGABI2DRAFT_190240 [Agaricus bisporus var. bisporus H97]|uniref:hypothetical protein n=1 Tax=Agaricus bisporus var. bisporus (strain H97 / ATCC MYA-4626 / FGSC 10389) TaxID=936046 RepID=UPI00029F6490|nr:hypothetical protein AGABI2DRAFT_190240 [Agaricus bisporus var. bisporus H97]EKV49789.1 hypothetical protein AGABI2DRAFT_190240 [Agaricus bisporus var. bisporus H97]